MKYPTSIIIPLYFEILFFSGKTDWVAIRNKYFINSLVSDLSIGATLSARTFELNSGNYIPIYSAGLKFNAPTISVSQFFGPLDIDIIKESNTYLDRVMNFGWLLNNIVMYVVNVVLSYHRCPRQNKVMTQSDAPK